MSGIESAENMLHDLQAAYKKLTQHFEEQVKTLSRDFDILKHSKNNTRDILIDWEDEILKISQAMIKFQKLHDHLEKVMHSFAKIVDHDKNNGNQLSVHIDTEFVVPIVVRSINDMIDEIKDLQVKTNKLKTGLPIVQSMQLFLRETSALLGKFCTAVVNVFMKIEPKQPAEAAKASMLTHFDKLRTSLNKHTTAFEKASATQLRSNVGFDL